MPTTTYKGFEAQTTGSNSGLWGGVLNTSMIEVADRNIGGFLTISLSNVDVPLNATQSQYLILRFTGVLLANVTVTTQAKGVTLIENLCTGNFTVSFSNGVGTPLVLPNSSRCLVATDASNAPRPFGEFPSGTRLAFQQTTPPVFWTKDVTHNNKALRIVSGTAGTGGSVDFTTAFASQTPAGTVGNTTLTIDQIPAHTHNLTYGDNNNDGVAPPFAGSNGNVFGTASVQSAGGGASHTHTFTGNAINLAVSYVDFVIAQKD